MRSTTPLDFAGHCSRCALNEAICICSEMPRIETRTEIVIVRHAAELRLTSNTGRFAALSLVNSRIVEFAGRARFDETELQHPRSALLYNSSGRVRQKELVEPPRQLIVLDGTYRQARRMYKRIEALREMPELAVLPPPIAPLRLRTPPRADGMSTLEAIAHALALLEGEAVAAPLFVLHAEIVRRMDALRGRRRDAVTAER